MKKIICSTVFALTLMCLLCFGVSATDFVDSGFCGADGDNVTWELYDDGTLVISGKGEMKDYYYGFYDGYEIAPYLSYTYEEGMDYYFIEDEKIKKVIIENGVTGIGSYAFTDCKKLGEIVIPDSVSRIGYRAFSYSALTEIDLPDNLTVIGDGAFMGSAITGINIPNGITEIGSDAFRESKIEEIYIPASVENIGLQTFLYSWNLKTITVAEENEYYSSEDGVLFNRHKTELIQYPIGKTEEEYTIPNGVKTIGHAAFEGCGNIRNIMLPDELMYIDALAFDQCSNLESITIPYSVWSIGWHAFSECASLTDIYYTGNEALWSGIEVNEDGNDCLLNATVHFNEEFDSYIEYGECGESATWELSYGDGTLIISGEGTIYEGAFEYNTIITSVVISEGITGIGADAFYGCSNLKSITLPDSITSIGRSAFCGTAYYKDDNNWEKTEGFCDGILYIGKCLIATIKDIDNGNNTAETLEVKDGTVVIADNAAEYEWSFRHIILPDSVAHIGREAFYDCGSLESIRIPKVVTFIDYDTFLRCESLTDVYYGGSEKDWIDAEYYRDGNEDLFNATIHFEGGNLILTDEDIYTGKTKTVYILPEQITYLKFVPEVTGNYIISSGYNTAVYLFDENKDEITYNPEGYLTCELKAGDTYYWGVSSSWNWEEERGKRDVTLEKACDHENTRTVEAVEPTCTQEGYTEGVYCDDCEEWIEGHEWLEGGHIDENSDRVCERCGEPAIHSEGSCGGNMTYDEEWDEWYSDGAAKYIRYLDGTLEIYGEGQISDWSFYDYWSVKEVIIYDGITGIGNYSFEYCYNLTKVTVPASVESIGVSAFSGCDNMEEISIYNPNCVIADDSDVIPGHTVICGVEGSTAEEYAEKYGKEFYAFCEHKNVGRVEAVAPTCTTVGYTEGEKCLNCGRPFSGCEKIAARHTDEDADSVCDVCDTELISDILPGETKTIEIISGEITRLKFIPSKTGMYTFCSLTDDDTYGYLYDENGAEITKNDDGENGWNFSISYELEAGVTYYWGARYCDEYQSGSFDVSLTYEEIACSHENVTAYEGAEATCTQDGYEAGVYCDDCQEWIEGHGAIDALGHDEITHEAKAPTCTEIGWNEYATCSRCDYSTYEEKSFTGHSHTPSVTAPTCTEAGYTTYTCSCGDSYVTDYIDALGHSYSSEITKEPTATAEGVETFTCGACSDRYTKAIPVTASEDKKTDIKAEYEYGTFDSIPELVIIEGGEKADDVFEDVFENYTSFNISFVIDGQNVQPDGKVIIKMPLPVGYNSKTTVVYYVDDNGKATRLNSVCENGYVIFETDHFSEYVLVDESSEIVYEPVTPEKPSDCSCNCHKSGIIGIIWKILRFFFKIFKTNPVCVCGVNHY